MLFKTIPFYILPPGYVRYSVAPLISISYNPLGIKIDFT